ncbi:MAG TPA: hypothetical protein G4N94_14425 [Caldilineae bacterium]|nr:hypothetical protein [Caldilineae bacterium]
MTLLDRFVLLLTGLTALYLIWRFFDDYRQTKSNSDIYYIISFAVLLVAGLLLIAFGYGVLGSPWVVIVSVLIPAGLSLGLVSEFFSKYEKGYLIFVIIGLLAIAITRLTGPEGATIDTIVLVIVHAIAGLIIVIVPILAVTRKLAPGGFIFVSIGGILIDLGGIALAFLKLGKQFLFFSESVVFTILAPLLLLMALAFAWGFMKKLKAA